MAGVLFLLDEVQLVRAAFDDDGRDVIDRQIAQEFLCGTLTASSLP